MRAVFIPYFSIMMFINIYPHNMFLTIMLARTAAACASLSCGTPCCGCCWASKDDIWGEIPWGCLDGCWLGCMIEALTWLNCAWMFGGIMLGETVFWWMAEIHKIQEGVNWKSHFFKIYIVFYKLISLIYKISVSFINYSNP